MYCNYGTLWKNHKRDRRHTLIHNILDSYTSDRRLVYRIQKELKGTKDQDSEQKTQFKNGL